MRGTGVRQISRITQKPRGFNVPNPESHSPISLTEREREEKLAYQASALSISEFPTIRHRHHTNRDAGSSFCLHKM